MEIIAIVSAAVAGTSLITNVYLAYLLRNQRTNVARDDDMRTRLYNLKHKLNETSLLTIPPHYEMWEYGFKSLEELREVAVKSYGQLEVAPDGKVSKQLRVAVREIFDDIKSLYAFRDSYARFAKGKVMYSQEAIEKWPDFERAKHALSVLQSNCRRNIPVIDDHLTKLY